MVTLRSSFGSPFGRKARIAVSVLGLDGKVKVEPASTQDDSDPLPKQNPLGKVPVLILDDGSTLFNSPVILEYLDILAGGGRILPKDTKARFDALRLEALATAFSMPASCSSTRDATGRPRWRCRSGSIASPARSRARSPARSDAAVARFAADRRADHARLRARLSRLPLQGRVAQDSSAACCLARQFRRARAGLRGHGAATGIKSPCDGN